MKHDFTLTGLRVTPLCAVATLLGATAMMSSCSAAPQSAKASAPKTAAASKTTGALADALPGSGEAIAPQSSAFNRVAGTGLQRLLLSPLDAHSNVFKGAWRLNDLTSDGSAADITPKFGESALTLGGTAEGAGAKGDFGLVDNVPGSGQVIGMWVYLAPDANVEKLGFQFYDAEGEALISVVAADWTGWKWLEVEVGKTELAQAYEQKDKNNRVDAPWKSVHAVWFARAAGRSEITVNALLAATKLTAANADLDAQLDGAGGTSGEANQPFSSRVLLTNYSDKGMAPRIEYSIQRDPSFYAVAPPDPIWGSDHALNARNWTEENGVRLDEGSLTDNRSWTSAATGWGEHSEAFQTLDLGRERLVSRVLETASDANWVWKLDVAASPDGKTYNPVPELQNVDLHGKWGETALPIKTPFAARFLRFRYHNGGAKVNVLRMPSSLSVYDGAQDESFALPKIGEEVASGTLSPQIGARSFGAVEIKSDKPLSPGAYLVAMTLRMSTHAGPETKRVVLNHHFVMPTTEINRGEASRFGLNTSTISYAPEHRRLGIGWVRFENMKWPMMSPSRGVFKFDGSVAPWNVPFDDIVSTYRKNSLSVLPFLFQTAPYASSAPEDKKNRYDAYPPANNADYSDFTFQVAARYGSRKHPASELESNDKKSGLNQIHTFEFWNEPNLTDPGWGPWVGTSAQYMELLRAGAEGVKRADPTALVTNGGWAGIDVGLAERLRLYKYADGKRPLDFIDILNVHYYSGLAEPELATSDTNADRSGKQEGGHALEDDLRRLVEWRDANKPKMPIWMSETGYDSAGPFGTDERTQAARLPRVIMMMLAAGIDKVIVYRESGSTPSMHAASGVFRDDGTKKPSWFTYATLIRQMDGVSSGVRLPNPDPNVRIYAWTRGKETIVSAWTIDKTANLDLKLGQSTVTDAFGNTRRADLNGNFSLSVFPTYFSSFANAAPVAALRETARKADEARRAQIARQAKLKSVLFDFGSMESVGSVEIGAPRSFTPVLSKDLYDEKKGFGFVAEAGGDNVQHWINDPLERDNVRVTPKVIWQFKAPKGRYRLQIRTAPLGDPLHFALRGATGGEQKLELTKDKPLVETTIDVPANATLSIESDNYGDLSWLSLIEVDAAK